MAPGATFTTAIGVPLGIGAASFAPPRQSDPSGRVVWAGFGRGITAASGGGTSGASRFW
jgi:hypothetical protein